MFEPDIEPDMEPEPDMDPDIEPLFIEPLFEPLIEPLFEPDMLPLPEVPVPVPELLDVVVPRFVSDVVSLRSALPVEPAMPAVPDVVPDPDDVPGELGLSYDPPDIPEWLNATPESLYVTDRRVIVCDVASVDTISPMSFCFFPSAEATPAAAHSTTSVFAMVPMTIPFRSQL